MPSRKTVLLVPPLSAHGDVASMTLYWDDLRRALEPYGDAGWAIESITAPEGWRTRAIRRRVSQRLLLPWALSHRMRTLRAQGVDPVVHVLDPHYSHLLPAAGGTVTCHDLDALVTPGKGLGKIDERSRLRQLVRARRIHAISRNTAADIARFFPETRERTVVNYYGIDRRFRRREPQSGSPHVDRLLSEKGAQFVLHVGSNIARKNIPCLLRSFAAARGQMKGQILKLVKVGGDFDADGFGPLLDELDLRRDLIFLGPLNTDGVVDVYNLCHVYAFPSLYEGFGRPLAEAQACGLPCVAANTSSLPEVGGDAALYHAADDHSAAAEAIVSILADRTIRAAAVERGILNSARFTWERHAEMLVESWT